MIDGLDTDDIKWLRAFFAPPNELHWDKLVDGTAPNFLAERVRPWLLLLGRANNQAPVILPFVRDGVETGWYATTSGTEGGHELGAEIRAWLGPTYLSVFEAVPSVTSDPMATALRRRSSRAVWRFTGPDAPSKTQIVGRLNDYVGLLARRPNLERQEPRPVGSIRADFERALLAKDAKGAETYCTELKSTGRLNEENLRYLEVHLNAGLGLWPQIARDHWLIQTMSDLEMPPQILSDIIEALYRTNIDEIEAAGSAAATLDVFDVKIARRYPRLFSSRHGIRIPRVVKAFLLFEQLQPTSSNELIDELGSLLTDIDRERVLVVTDTNIIEAPTDLENDAEEAFDDLQYDRAFAFYYKLPLSRKVISRLLACAQFIGTDMARDRLLEIIDTADPTLIASLGQSVQNKIAAFRTTVLMPSPAIESSSEASPEGAENAPAGWIKWAQQLARGEDLAGAERAIQDAVTNWDTQTFNKSEAHSSTFADIVGNLNGDAELLARKSVPQIFASFFPQEIALNPNTKPIAELLVVLIAMDESLSSNDLELLAQLLVHLLNLGLSSEEYVSLISDLNSVQDRVQSYAHLPWSLDICETLAIAPAQSEAGRAARLAMFVGILGQAQSFAHRLGPQDLLPLEFLAKDFGVDLGAIGELNCYDASDGPTTALPDLAGKTIGIYTLVKTAGDRAKASLEKMFPGCTVKVNSDLVATERLKNLANNADIFVFAWKSSSHAAFYCIKEALPRGEPIWALGKGSASILRAVLDNVQ